MIQAEHRQNLFDTMSLREKIVSLNGVVLVPDVAKTLQKKVDRILEHKDRYLAVAHKFSNPGLKWWLIAVIHEMECSLDFTKYLGNGQSIHIKTTIVPKGRGPFETWEEGAIDAIDLKHLNDVTDWSMGSVLYILEGYNGYGYNYLKEPNKPINSPYLWSSTNHYTSGKYVKDGIYNANTVSTQIGVAPLLQKLINQ